MRDVVDETGAGLAWWRVAAIDDVGRRVHFVDPDTAEALARYLLATTTALVVLEHWRGDQRIDYEVMLPPYGA